MDLIDRTKYRKDLLAAYDDVSMEFDVLDSQPTIKAVPLDKVKKAREEIDDLSRYFDNGSYSGNEDSMFKCNEVLEILDELIAESEGNSEDNG